MRRSAIEAAIYRAIDAGGDNYRLESMFNLLDTALAGLLALLPSGLQEVVMVAYIRGYADNDPDHYVRQAKTMLDIATLDVPASAELCNLLKQYLGDFLALRRGSQDVAKYFFNAVCQLWPTTVQMGEAVE